MTHQATKPPVRRVWSRMATWFDNTRHTSETADAARKMDLVRLAPFLILHGACLAVLWVGWSWIAVAVAVGFYLLRALFVTAFYHRYFSHKSYRTSRPAQLLFAVLGNTAVQRGVLWWAAHHRQHHRTSDQEGDPHSPRHHSFYWSHLGWITAPENFPTNLRLIPDLARYPELRWLDRFDTLVPILCAAGMFGLGTYLETSAPGLGTSGPQMLVWGFFVSTVILFHVTGMVNSVAHVFGKRRFPSGDDSRNNVLVALLALGEGWHNNHHFQPHSARQGFYWWEIDVTFYFLKVLQWLGVIWDLRMVSPEVLEQARKADAAA
jgi:stearoyl-CoA desaturase (delta-9 desaturase)